MPETTPKQKVERVKMFGGKFINIVLFGDTFDDAQEEAQKQLNKDSVFIHPFDDIDVIEGQGTIALEILDQIDKHFDYLVIPIGGGGLIAAKAAPVDDILEEASHLESPDQPKKKGSFFGRIRKPSRSLLQAAQASSDVCEPLQEVELRVSRDPPSDDEEEPPDALQGLDPRNPSKYASLAKRHPQQVSFCRGRGTKQGTSHEFLDKGAEGLLKNSEAGCGQMLDHFLICGGLDALLARITPSSGLECSSQKLGELLRAFEIVCDRAAPTTAPHFALSYARHLQRAAHARLRREASSATVSYTHLTLPTKA